MATADSVGEHIQEERDILRSGTRQIKEKLEQKSEEAWDDLVESIRTHPARALGITLATGVVVGLSAAALTRRRHTGLQDAIETLKYAIDKAITKFK